MFDVLYSANGNSTAYVDHPKFLKVLTEKFGKGIITATYRDTHNKGREIGWNVLVPTVEVPELKKLSKEYVSPADEEIARKAQALKEQERVQKKAEREKAKAEAKEAKKAERKAAKQAAKQSEQISFNI